MLNAAKPCKAFSSDSELQILRAAQGSSPGLRLGDVRVLMRCMTWCGRCRGWIKDGDKCAHMERAKPALGIRARGTSLLAHQAVIDSLPTDDALTVLNALGERLLAEKGRERQLQRGLKRGWGLEDLLASSPAELDWKAGKSKAGGRPPRPKCDGERLRSYRGDLTQEEVAEKCGVPVKVIQRGESGAGLSDENYIALARGLSLYLGVTITPTDLQNK